MLMAAVLSLPR